MRTEADRPFETELDALAPEIGLTPEQKRAVAKLYREQIDATLDLAVEIASDDIDLENARHD
jgi:hypothetical protein